MRVAKRVKDLYPHLSLNFIKSLIKDGKVRTSYRVLKLSDKVKDETEIYIDKDFLEDKLKSNSNINCDLVYEDKNLIIINKPHQLHSVAQSYLDQDTVANFLLSVNPNLRNVSSPLESGLINRLDYETSGLMMVAKTKSAFEYFKSQMKDQKIIKHYQCLVSKNILEKKLYLAMVKPSSKSRSKVRLIPYERVLENEFETIKTEVLSSIKFNDKFLVTLRLITGFRHQIRVHLADLGTPIVGDNLYEGDTSDRLYLHASLIRFSLPNGEKIEVVSPHNW